MKTNLEIAREVGAAILYESYAYKAEIRASTQFRPAELNAFAAAVIEKHEALRQAGQEPFAWLTKGGHFVYAHIDDGLAYKWAPLYTTPQPAAQSARADFEAWFRENYHSRLDRKCANQTYNCPAAFAAWNTWEACAKVYAAAQPAVERKPLTDEQIDEIRIVQEFWQWDVGTGVFRHIARAIEAAHGITPATQRATHEK